MITFTGYVSKEIRRLKRKRGQGVKIEKLESYLGKRVKIKVLDDVLIGRLQKTRTEAVKNNPNLYHYKPNFYTIVYSNGEDNSFLFRASYVQSIKEL